MWPDLQRVIEGAASRFASTSCIELSKDMLISIGNEKLTRLLNKIEGDYCTPLGVVDCERSSVPSMRRIRSRVDFFKYFKACLNNHIRALIHRHIFTEKRTGVKPPPKPKKGEIPDIDTTATYLENRVDFDDDDDGIEQDFESYRQSEVRLDNPDNYRQVAGEADARLDEQMYEEIQPFLTPAEKMVCASLYKPDAGCLLFALMDARRNCKPTEIKIAYTEVHHAESLGIPLYVFRKIKQQLTEKVLNYMKTGEANTDQNVLRNQDGEHDAEQTEKFNLAKAQLCEFFDMEVPDYIDKMIVRRAFTIAARDQADKLEGKPHIVELLKVVGAKPPIRHANTLSCYGVLYKTDNKACCVCHRRKACAVEASNLGLGEITLSPQLLGSKLTRIPVITAQDQVPDNRHLPDFANDRDEEIFHYLCENFEKFTHKGEIHFRHRDSGMEQSVFNLDSQSKFRFCRPSESMQAELEKVKNSYFLPDDVSVDEAVELIQKHAKETYATVA